MKSFLEMLDLIEQGAVATPNPNMQQNKMQNTAPNSVPNAGTGQPNNQNNPNQNNPNKNNLQNNNNVQKYDKNSNNDPEVQKFVDELTKMLDDGTDLGNFQSQLKKYIGNPKFQEAATKTGPEDKLAVNNQPIDVSLLVPTQAGDATLCIGHTIRTHLFNSNSNTVSNNQTINHSSTPKCCLILLIHLSMPFFCPTLMPVALGSRNGSSSATDSAFNSYHSCRHSVIHSLTINLANSSRRT
jgi:hypothetical protein